MHQILANYQAGVQVDDGTGSPSNHGRPFGGDGFLRLMRFHPDGNLVSIKSYSPWYDRFLTQPDQQFQIGFQA